MSEIINLLKRKNIEFIDKSGSGDVILCCLSPLHEDSSPSMRIDKITGKYHCFACGFGGTSIFDYFNEYYSPVTREAAELQRKISNIMTDATGITLPEGIEFYLGDYRDIPPKIYKEFKAFQHPNFEDRLCFPIEDVSGKITNIVARNFFSDVPPKYKMYPAGRSVPIYPHVRGRYAILVEGIFDVLNLKKHGVPNVAALFGTQSLSDRNISEKLNPLIIGGVRDIFLLLDNDAAGNKSALSLKKLIEIKTNIRVTILNEFLPPGKDPGCLNSEELSKVLIEINKLLD